VILLAALCLADKRQTGNSAAAQTGDRIMPSYSPELIQTMRAALDEVMTKIPLDQATPAIKSALGRTHLENRCGGPNELRCIAGRGLGQHSNDPFDAHVNRGAVAA